MTCSPGTLPDASAWEAAATGLIRGQRRVAAAAASTGDAFPTHLFNSEVVDEVVIVFVQAAVQGHAVRVDEQVLQGGHALQTQGALHAVR